MNDYTFGNFLYTLRLEKGLSQSQFGEMLGVSNKAVSKWETGSAKPNTALIPKIAEIFNISVEELFACKRFEKDSQYVVIKNHLSNVKIKYAVLSSLFLSHVITLPLLLIEFICIIMSFHIPDDIVGPLGSLVFIFSFTVSITALVIYRKNFKQANTHSENTYSSRFIITIRVSHLFSGLVCLFIFITTIFIYLLILNFSTNMKSAKIFLSFAIFFFIIFLGTFICLTNIKRLLKIESTKSTNKDKKPIKFYELPIWAKICYISFIVVGLFFVFFQILQFFNNDLFLIRFILQILLFAFGSPLLIYMIKNK